MISAEKSKNKYALDFIFNHDSVHPYICDDSTKDSIFYSENLLKNDQVVFYECKKNGETFGAILFYPFRTYVMDVHCACLPHLRGKIFIDAALLAINDIFSSTTTNSIIATCAESNRPSMIFAIMCGLERVGEIPKSHIKNKKKESLIIYQLSKGG